MPFVSRLLSCLNWRLLLFLLLLGGTTLWLCTRQNAFPYTYHPDEDTKVRQIVSDKRNFFHPLLLLTTTSAVYQTGIIPKTPMNAAIIGRWVSAAFTALAIVALCLLAWRWGGWLSTLGAAALLLLNPLGFELAHYFKEDPALLFGLAATFLALDYFWKNPAPGTATFLGMASALALSGKYLGAVVFLFVLPLLIARCRQENAGLALWFFFGLFATVIVFNLPLLKHFADFTSGLGREMDGATGGHRGLSRDIPHGYYLTRLREITPPAVGAGLFLSLAAILWQRSRSVPQILTLVFPFFFIALLSFSPKTATRYALPATMFFSFLAGVAPGLLLRSSVPGRFRAILVIISSLATLATVLATSFDYRMTYADFLTDSRDGLRQWIDTHTPPDAIIAQDERVDLLAADLWKNRTVLDSEFVADLGSLDEQRARGISYIAVSHQSYNRFLSGLLKPQPKEKADFERRAGFYQTLFKTGKLVWESPMRGIIYLHPGLRLYQINPNP